MINNWMLNNWKPYYNIFFKTKIQIIQQLFHLFHLLIGQRIYLVFRMITKLLHKPFKHTTNK